MKTIRITLDEITRKKLDIGYMGENEHTQVVIACGAVFATNPDAGVSMTVNPPTGDMYPAVIAVEDACLIWEVTDGDLAHAGDGSFQLTFIDNAEIIKTAIGSFTVKQSLVATGERPDPVQNWIDNANETVTRMTDAWLEENITNPDSPPLDRSLSSAVSAAPADIVGDIKGAFNGTLIPNAFTPTLTSGKYIRFSDGTIASSTKYARTNIWNGYGNNRNAIELTGTTYECAVFYYDATGNLSDGTGYLGHSEYAYGIQYIPKQAVKFALSFRRVDQAVLADADITAMTAALKIYNQTDETISTLGRPADAKATGSKISAAMDNGVMYFRNKNIFTDPMFLNSYTDDGVEVVADDNGNVLHLTNSGSTVKTFVNMSETIANGTTLYFQFYLKGSANNLTFRISSGTSASSVTTVKDTNTKTTWTKVTYSAAVGRDSTGIRIALTESGQAWVKDMIVSKTAIDYDFSVKNTVADLIPIVTAHGTTLNGNIKTDNFEEQLRNLFYKKYSQLTLTLNDGYVTTSGNVSTSTGKYASFAVVAGEEYQLSSNHGSNLKMYVLKDGDGNVVEYYPTTSESTKTEVKNVVISTSGTLYLNTYNTSDIYAKKVIGIGVDSDGGFAGKTWFALGDSITHANYGYHSQIASETGVVVTNGGVSGSGYMKPVNNKTFVDRSALTSVYDFVTVFGSVNDMQYVSENLGTESDTGTSTLGGCFNTVIDNLYASGNYHIGIISPIPQGTTAGNPANTTGSFAQYVDLLEKVCKRRGVPFLDLWHCSNMQPWDEGFAEVYMSDETHPNRNGHAIFAPRIKAFIQCL